MLQTWRNAAHRVPTSCLRYPRYLWGAPSKAAGARVHASTNMPRKIRPKRQKLARIQSKYKSWLVHVVVCPISRLLWRNLNWTFHLIKQQDLCCHGEQGFLSAPGLITKEAPLLSTFMLSQERWMTQLFAVQEADEATTPLTLSFLVDWCLESMLPSNQGHSTCFAGEPHTRNCGNPWGLFHWKQHNIIHPYVCWITPSILKQLYPHFMALESSSIPVLFCETDICNMLKPLPRTISANVLNPVINVINLQFFQVCIHIHTHYVIMSATREGWFPSNLTLPLVISSLFGDRLPHQALDVEAAEAERRDAQGHRQAGMVATWPWP